MSNDSDWAARRAAVDEVGKPRTGEPFNFAEDVLIVEAAIDASASPVEVAEMLGRTYASVVRRARTLGCQGLKHGKGSDRWRKEWRGE